MTIPTEKVTFEIWKFVIDLNFMGIVYGTYTAIPIMREQGFGHIVNTASITGRIPVPYQAVYAVSYTHLDVYKRQVKSSRHQLTFIPIAD